jgi:hypothetical protein
VDLKTKAVSTLRLEGVDAPKRPDAADQPVLPSAVQITVPEKTVPNEGDLALQIDLRSAPGFKLSLEASMSYFVETLPEAKLPWSENKKLPDVKSSFRVSVPAAKLAGSRGLRFTLVYYECGEGSSGLCRVKSQVWEVPLKFDPAATERVIQLSGPSVPKEDSKPE